MNRPDDRIISDVLEEKATAKQARQVAKWFSTEEGQNWLSKYMDKVEDDINSGKAEVKAYSSSEELLIAINEVIDRIQLQHKRKKIAFRWAAILIPCILIGSLWINLNSRIGGKIFADSSIIQTVNSSRGERKEIIFQDGTHVFLNAGTKISYPEHFGIRQRRIAMSGEAYFIVSPNKRRPFVVEIGDASIKVFGTTFNVKAYESQSTVQVVLINGHIAFNHNGAQYMMQPSQELIYDKQTGKIDIHEEERADRTILWSKNIISFRDTPLAEVIETLSRWYNVQFQVSDPKALKCFFTLQTPPVELTSLLQDMESISNLNFSLNKKDSTVTVSVRQ